MGTSLEQRIRTLEAIGQASGAFAHLTDAELDQRILRLHLGRDPSPEELSEWLGVPAAEAERRTKVMLSAVRSQLAQTHQGRSDHASA